jgi:hypothetical protein
MEKLSARSKIKTTLMIVIFSSVASILLVSMSHAVAQSPSANKSSMSPPPSATVKPPTPQQGPPPTVKITSLTKGQMVPLGILTILGVSSDSPSSLCGVSVILNGQKPYQPTTPMGTGGKSDFSKWKFTFTSQYATIVKGMNKITPKIECRTASGNVTKFNSLNVTGTSNSTQSATLLGPANVILGQLSSSTFPLTLLGSSAHDSISQAIFTTTTSSSTAITKPDPENSHNHGNQAPSVTIVTLTTKAHH